MCLCMFHPPPAAAGSHASPMPGLLGGPHPNLSSSRFAGAGLTDGAEERETAHMSCKMSFLLGPCLTCVGGQCPPRGQCWWEAVVETGGSLGCGLGVAIVGLHHPGFC